MKTKKIFATLAISLSLAGCQSMFGNDTSIANLSLAERAEEETSATIILSAGVRQVCFSSYPVTIDLVNTDQRKTVEMFTANNEFIKPELDENHGFLHAANIAPGNYLMTMDVWARRVTSRPVARFSIEKGEVLYLGEFFLDSSCAGFGSYVDVLIRNRSSRDLPKAQELNPGINMDEVEVRVLQFESESLEEQAESTDGNL
ncbi:MAG: hypothetical protein AAGE86_02805 [Pseudomonadota bacterium]